MPIDLRSKSGGGSLVPTFYSGTLTHNLSSSNPLIISSAKRLRLDNLSATPVASNVTVESGSQVIIDDLALFISPTADGSFAVGVNVSGSSTGAVLLPFLQSINKGDSITISSTSATARTITYSFSEVEEVI